MLWDVGTYTIDYPFTDYESDSEQTQRRKRRKAERSAVFEDEDSEDPSVSLACTIIHYLITDVLGSLGTHEEDKFRLFLTRTLSPGKSRSIHFTLKAGYKVGRLELEVISSRMLKSDHLDNAAHKSLSVLLLGRLDTHVVLIY